MYCSKCGNKLLSGVKFCSICGTAVSGQVCSDVRISDSGYEMLVEYFKMLVDMETNIYMQQNVIKLLENKINSLGIKKEIQAPVLEEEKGNIFSFAFSGFIAGLIFGPIVWFVAGIIIAAFGGYLEISFKMIGKFMIGTGCVVFVICILAFISGKNKEQEKYGKEYSEYIEQCRVDKERLKKEEWQKQMLDVEKRKMQRGLEDSIHNLQMAYNKNICYEKYRNMIAVCSIYEYLASKRCFQLSGSDGCYNLFEQESRDNLIILKLDQIISKLEQVQKNQNKLYVAINESNKKAQNIFEATNQMIDTLYTTNSKHDDMSKGISALDKQTAVDSYNTDRIAQELEYLNRMELKTDKYKDIVFYQK